MADQLQENPRFSQTKFSFGATSAIMTNLALIVGLRTGGHAKLSIIAGILIIAFADNISDSFGIHIYQDSEGLAEKEVWLSTFYNFFTRILVSLSFIFLVALFPIKLAVISSVIWGVVLLATISHAIAKNKKVNPYRTMSEHVGIATFVIIVSNFVGKLIITKFNL